MSVKTLCKWVLGLGVAALATQSARADLASWHVTPANGSQQFDQNFTAMWVPYGIPGTTPNPNNASAPATGNVNGIDYTIWDNYGPHGNATTGSFHNVNDFGGQQFDAKAMFVRNDANNLYVGVVTGFNPAGLTEDGVHYTPGDLAINLNAAGHTSQFGVISLTGAAGTTGHTSLVVGGNWITPNAAQGWDDVPTNYNGGGATLGTDSQFTSTDLGIKYRDDTTGTYVDTYLLEYTIPLNELALQPGQTLSFSWGPSCGNDIITSTHTLTAVPEPASLSIFGGASILLLARRRTKRAA